ncbi:serine hydrolase domain-containing protein [Aquimarina algiphila]|uniref:serine hydrolase domain-containing protein n=1 Tax=Aquimarina algiphila TaxID=2047982 RepID=UPI00232F7C83|nr:serine hydrolase domain-containing protein [Aquimarina algiphila]
MKTLITLLILFPLVGNAQQLSSLMNEKISNNTDNPVYSISIFIENDGDVLASEAVGKRKREGNAIEITDQFRIASSTKLFVATIILQLEEEGKLRLNAPIYKHLNGMNDLQFEKFHLYQAFAFSKAITIKHLLSHRSGLADIFNDRQEAFFGKVMATPNRQYRPEDMVNLYFEFELNKDAKFKPGEEWRYSDMNYVLLGFLIEKLDGKSLSQSIRDRILNPLKMQDTYFEFYEKTHSNNGRIHQYVGNTDFNAINTSFDWSGGGLVSTHQDLTIFIKALFNGKLMSYESLEKMIAVQPTKETELPYGLGVYQSVYCGETFYGHYGFYGTYIGYAPKTKTVLSYCISQATPSFNVYEFVNSVIETIK